MPAEPIFARLRAECFRRRAQAVIEFEGGNLEKKPLQSLDRSVHRHDRVEHGRPLPPPLFERDRGYGGRGGENLERPHLCGPLHDRGLPAADLGSSGRPVRPKTHDRPGHDGAGFGQLSDGLRPDRSPAPGPEVFPGEPGGVCRPQFGLDGLPHTGKKDGAGARDSPVGFGEPSLRIPMYTPAWNTAPPRPPVRPGFYPPWPAAASGSSPVRRWTPGRGSPGRPHDRV